MRDTFFNGPDHVQIPVKKLAEFLTEKGVGDDCPACGTERGLSISVNDPEGKLGDDAPAVWLLHRLPDNYILGFGVFIQACRNCGYLRYFQDSEVLDFLEEGEHNGA